MQAASNHPQEGACVPVSVCVRYLPHVLSSPSRFLTMLLRCTLRFAYESPYDFLTEGNDSYHPEKLTLLGRARRGYGACGGCGCRGHNSSNPSWPCCLRMLQSAPRTALIAQELVCLSVRLQSICLVYLCVFLSLLSLCVSVSLHPNVRFLNRNE